MDFCDRYPLIAWTRPEANDRVLFTRLRCKQWSCEYCARKNASIWHAFLLDRLPAVSDSWWFVTLTAHSRMRSQEASYKNLQRGIDVIMKRIRRVFGKVEYVRVYEKHPSSDALHAHLLISNLSPFVVPGCHKNMQPGYLAVTVRSGHKGVWSIRTWIKKTAQECQVGYQADVSALRGNTSFAVHYVTKYLTKVSQSIDIRGLRHVQTSQGIGSPTVESEYFWRVASYITARDFHPGDVIYDLNLQHQIDPEYWSEHDQYPDDMPD